MYALKARDKLHKREKEEVKDREREALRRAREVDSYHRGETSYDPQVADRAQPSTSQREAKYVGTFSLQLGGGWKKVIPKLVKQELARINTKQPTSCISVYLLVNVEGVKVISTDGQQLIMAHALQRILYVTADTKKCLFVLVARNPQTGAEGVYGHVFAVTSKEKSKDLSELVGKAFKASFTKQTLKRGKKSQPQQASPPTSSSVSPRPWSVIQEQPPSHNQTSPPHNQTSLHPPSGQGQRLSGEFGQRLSGEFGGAAHRAMPSEGSGHLEHDVMALHSMIRDIETRISEVGSDEDAILELTVQLSTYQQQLDEKKRRLYALQQAAAHVRPPPPPDLQQTAAHVRPPDIDSVSLEDAEWFQAGLPREIAMEILSQQSEGAFIVRDSSSNPGSYALTLRAPGGKILHFLLEYDSSGVHFGGSTQSFPTLVSLILHHSQYQEHLPCLLSLGEANPTFTDRDTHSPIMDQDYLDPPPSYHLLDMYT